MKIFKYSIFWGLLIAIRPIMAQNDTLLFYDFYYNQFKVEKFILFVDQKSLNDSTKVCTVFEPCSWYGLISTIPLEFYKVKNRALICFFYDYEDYSKIEEDYVLKYWDTLKSFSDTEDEYRLISWEKRQLKTIKGTSICDPPIFKLIIKNGRIIEVSSVISRLYNDNCIQYYFVDPT